MAKKTRKSYKKIYKDQIRSTVEEDFKKLSIQLDCLTSPIGLLWDHDLQTIEKELLKGIKFVMKEIKRRKCFKIVPLYPL